WQTFTELVPMSTPTRFLPSAIFVSSQCGRLCPDESLASTEKNRQERSRRGRRVSGVYVEEQPDLSLPGRFLPILKSQRQPESPGASRSERPTGSCSTPWREFDVSDRARRTNRVVDGRLKASSADSMLLSRNPLPLRPVEHFGWPG